MKYFFLIFILFLYGCGLGSNYQYRVAPKLGQIGMGHKVNGNANRVQVSNVWHSGGYAKQIAQAHCKKHGKDAYTKDFAPFIASYDCMTKEQYSNLQVARQNTYNLSLGIKTPSSSNVVNVSDIDVAKSKCFEIGYKETDKEFKTCVLTIIEANAQKNIYSNDPSNALLRRNAKILEDLQKAENFRRRNRMLNVACQFMSTCPKK